MKRTLTLSTIFVFLISFGAVAQSGLGNLDFENWGTNGVGEPQPVGFASLGATENTADPQEGNSAVKLEVYYNTLISDTIGALALGEISGMSILIGDSYTQCPDSLTGYFRHDLLNKDTATVKAEVWTNSGDTLAEAEMFLGGTENEWTYFSMPFSPMDCGGMLPDSIGIYFTAESVGFGQYAPNFEDKGTQTVGSVFEVDAVYLHDSTNTGLLPLKGTDEEYAAYPNPAKEQVRFEFGANAERIRIFDMTGREARTVLLNARAENALVDLKGMNEGLYIYRIEGAEGEELHSGKLQVLR